MKEKKAARSEENTKNALCPSAEKEVTLNYKFNNEWYNSSSLTHSTAAAAAASAPVSAGATEAVK